MVSLILFKFTKNYWCTVPLTLWFDILTKKVKRYWHRKYSLNKDTQKPLSELIEWLFQPAKSDQQAQTHSVLCNIFLYLSYILTISQCLPVLTKRKSQNTVYIYIYKKCIFSSPISVVSLTVVKAKSSLCHGQWLLHRQCPVCLYASNIIRYICAFMHVFELWFSVLLCSASQNSWQAVRSIGASVHLLQAVEHIEQLHRF